MKIEELEHKHWQVVPIWKLGSLKIDMTDASQHTKLSIQFAIEMLEDLQAKMESGVDQYNWWFTDKVEDKVEELKNYLK